MSEINPGLRVLEMHEREAWHRARAQREAAGVAVDDGPKRRRWRRTLRRAA